MFLFKSTLLIAYCWFIDIKLAANSTVSQVWTKLTCHMFSPRGTSQPFVHLGTLVGTSALCWGAILNREIAKNKPNQTNKHNNVKIRYQIHWKGYSFSAWKRKQEDKVWPCLTSAVNITAQQLKFSQLCTGPQEAQARSQYWFEVTNKCEWMRKSTNSRIHK